MLTAAVLLLVQFFFPALAYNVHTGFNYGAFWGTPDKPKRKWEYTRAFKIAYNLNTSVAFDSARLFTCRQPGTTDTWIEAFDAAVETHTYLLLGFYLSETRESARKPSQTYETNAEMLHHELKALEKALVNYGWKLADLIIGLSVGNEDMEKWYAGRNTGIPENVISENINTVHSAILGASVFGETFPNIMKYMQDKPVGHTDTAPHAAKVKKVNFVGMNAYPYWSKDPPTVAKASYFGSLNGVKQAIPGKEIWLTEVGWPFNDTASDVASQGTANKDSLQKFWNDVGCDVFGKYTTFWFELTMDTVADQPDWAIIDGSTGDSAPRIDVSCGIGRKVWAPNRREVSSSAAPATMVTGTSKLTQASPAPYDLAPASQNIYTGFSYGAFWSESEPKRYKDFLRQFNLARNLSNVPVPFTSARLYQAAQWGSPTEPSEAFQAAIETNTTLLIGLWLPIDNELAALDKAFRKYGQKLADLVIGIAVGNEDIYRGSDECTQKEGKPCPMAATEEEIIGNITHVKDWMQGKTWYKLFRVPPPIGHADTARNAALKKADFMGANIFPFWHPDPIENAWVSFEESLQGVKERAGNVPVWITETGWPSAGNDSTATLDNMQNYWWHVGCSLIGKYTTFWFELEKDTHDMNDLDWGLMDIPSQKLKFKDLSCPHLSDRPLLPSLSRSSTLPASTLSLTATTTTTDSSTTSTTSFLPITITATTPSSTPQANSTSTFVPSQIHGDIPCNTSTSCTHSMAHLLPSAARNTTVLLPTAAPYGSMTIQTGSLPTSATRLVTAPDNNSSDSATGNRSTTHITITSTITVQPSQDTGAPPSNQDAITTNLTIQTTLNKTAHLPSSFPPAPTSKRPCSVPASAPATTKPVVFVTEPTGCITISRDANGTQVTISNPPVSGKCPIPTYAPPLYTNASASASPQSPTAHPTGCVVVSQNASGRLVTLATNPAGKCASPPTTVRASASASASAAAAERPTVWVTEATGCITVSKNAKGEMVTVASNPPVSGKCATPTYGVEPTYVLFSTSVSAQSTALKKTTAYLSPSPVVNSSVGL